MNRLKIGLSLVAALVLAMAMAGTAMAAESSFTDVAADAWYADAVAFVQEQGLMNGNTATKFAPEESLTRAMLVTVLYRFEREPDVFGDDGFSDTADGQWYSSAVLWATQNGVVNGYGEGLFGPNDSITQEQLNLIMSRYADAAVTEDVPGLDGTAEPATRAQVAAVLMKLAAWKEEASADEEQKEDTEAAGKVLVAYFSATGSTKDVAGYIANALGADIYEITPEQPYTTADLDWTNSSSRVSVEHAGGDSGRPAISGGVENMAQYDVVFIGYPIWWGEAPNIVRTFMESYDFGGKTLVPFCTSSSSGLGQSGQNLHSLAAEANWLAGERFSSGASESTVAAWANGLKLGK